YREGLKLISAGADPMAISRGIQAGVEKVVAELARMAERIDPKDMKEITEVATIASNNNTEIGEKLAEAMKDVGANGVITVAELLRPHPRVSFRHRCVAIPARRDSRYWQGISLDKRPWHCSNARAGDRGADLCPCVPIA